MTRPSYHRPPFVQSQRTHPSTAERDFVEDVVLTGLDAIRSRGKGAEVGREPYYEA
jgi:hypothetical protein